jgi:hypothetical protein
VFKAHELLLEFNRLGRHLGLALFSGHYMW